MPLEIERKFLVRGDAWRSLAESSAEMRQGYLCRDPDRSVRARLAGDRGTLTIKGRSQGAVRSEYEYAIPAGEARELLDGLCLRPQIEKTRHRVPVGDLVWEVDVFSGENAGLVVAEVELDDPEQELPLPDWVGEEVTGDPRYLNANLVANPFSRW